MPELHYIVKSSKLTCHISVSVLENLVLSYCPPVFKCTLTFLEKIHFSCSVELQKLLRTDKTEL